MMRKARFDWISIISIILSIAIAVGAVSISTRQRADIACVFNKSNTSKTIHLNLNKGDLKWSLTNKTKTKTGYTVQYKASSSASFSKVWSGYLAGGKSVGPYSKGKSNGWTKRYFRITQTTNLSANTTKALFVAYVI